MSKSIDFALKHIGEEIPVRLSLDNALCVKVKKGTVIGYNDILGVLIGFADKSGLPRYFLDEKDHILLDTCLYETYWYLSLDE